jgi:hypothetical protein
MRPLTGPELLGVWERGLAQKPIERAQALLAAACPETPPDALADFRVGLRDASLLTLREWTFGPQAASIVACPLCGQRHELNFSMNDLRVESSRETNGEVTVSGPDYELFLRVPNGIDLAAIAREKDVARARLILFERCLLASQRDGREARAEELPEEAVKAAADRLAQADPQADVLFALSCQSCGHQWQEPFDIVSFFWSEIHSWACRTLADIHALASAYGWREAEILLIHPWRRQFYLEMISE